MDQGVDLRLFRASMSDPFSPVANHRSACSLWDIYPLADLVTYPSLYEGFGNALLEAIYFKRPILVNRYPIFVRDIEPKGFKFIVMDGFLTPDIVAQVKEAIASSEAIERITGLNYHIARRHFSFNTLRKGLGTLISNFFGTE